MNKAYGIRNKEIVCELGVPPDINDDNKEEWINAQRVVYGDVLMTDDPLVQTAIEKELDEKIKNENNN